MSDNAKHRMVKLRKLFGLVVAAWICLEVLVLSGVMGRTSASAWDRGEPVEEIEDHYGRGIWVLEDWGYFPMNNYVIVSLRSPGSQKARPLLCIYATHDINSRSLRLEIAADGITIVGYHPHHAYLDNESIEKLLRVGPAAMWDGVLPSPWTLDPRRTDILLAATRTSSSIALVALAAIYLRKRRSLQITQVDAADRH